MSPTVLAQPELDHDQCECAAVACSLYGDEYSGDASDEERWEDGLYLFSAAQGQLLQSAAQKLCARRDGDLEQPLERDELVLAAAACDLYAEDFCGEGHDWGQAEVAILQAVADAVCRALELYDEHGYRPAGESLIVQTG